jgi:hypothetical protein
MSLKDVIPDEIFEISGLCLNQTPDEFGEHNTDRVQRCGDEVPGPTQTITAYEYVCIKKRWTQGERQV